jgi:uncharacterized protein YecE (DUF72 family)
MARIPIGTSGFHYAHWVGPFYPSGTRPAQFLEHYLRHFDTVEINNTFYRLPTAAMLQSWVDATPEDFVFACKGSRFTTHVKRLADPPVAAQKFFDVIGTLGEKLGPILFQLPPRWSPNLERLATFLAWLPREHRYAFEFRDESWFLPEVLALLRRYQIALCIYDFDGRRSPVEVTAPFAYVRLHGPGRRYHGSYSGPALSRMGPPHRRLAASRHRFVCLLRQRRRRRRGARRAAAQTDRRAACRDAGATGGG